MDSTGIDACRVFVTCSVCIVKLCLWAPGLLYPCVKNITEIEEVPSSAIINSTDLCPREKDATSGFIEQMVGGRGALEGTVWALGFKVATQSVIFIIGIASIWFSYKKIKALRRKQRVGRRRRIQYSRLLEMENRAEESLSLL